MVNSSQTVNLACRLFGAKREGPTGFFPLGFLYYEAIMGVVITEREYKELTYVYDRESISFFRREYKMMNEYRFTHNDELPQTLFVRYLEERRSIDPKRFDRFHPVIGRWIADQPIVMTPPPSPPITSQSVPEPTSFILLVIGMIVATMYRKIMK